MLATNTFRDAVKKRAYDTVFYTCQSEGAIVKATNNGRPVAEVAYRISDNSATNLTNLTPSEKTKALASSSSSPRVIASTTPEPAHDDSTRSQQSLAPADIWNDPLPQPTRVITTEYRETDNWTVEYGQESGGIVVWNSRIQFRLILSLGQTQSQSVNLYWSQLDGREVAPDVNVDLYMQEGAFEPDWIDGGQIGSDLDDQDIQNYTYRTENSEDLWLSPTEEGHKYHVEEGAMSLWDLESGQQFTEFETAMVGFRWDCPVGGVCWFPNGEEAPIF